MSAATPNPVQTLVDGERRNGSFHARSSSPGRLYVLIAATRVESDVLQHAWTGQAVDVQPCPNLAAALVLIGRLSPHMVVVGDWVGPLGPVNFVESLREIDAEVPVIVGIDDGAPAGLGAELLTAGVTAIVRRPFAPDKVLRLLHASQDVPFETRPLPIDLGRLRVDGVSPRIWLDGVESTLPAMEYRLLRYLAERHGEILPRRELLEAAWGESARSSNSLAVHIHRLRTRLEGDDGEWIRPVRNIGYQFLVPKRDHSRADPGRSQTGPRSMRRHED